MRVGLSACLWVYVFVCVSVCLSDLMCAWLLVCMFDCMRARVDCLLVCV